jgi:hypothetical protein
MNTLICVCCESPLLTAQEEEDELCNVCLGNAAEVNNNKNKEEIEDGAGDNPVAVDRMLARGRPMNFGDLEPELEDEDE